MDLTPEPVFFQSITIQTILKPLNYLFVLMASRSITFNQLLPNHATSQTLLQVYYFQNNCHLIVLMIFHEPY